MTSPPTAPPRPEFLENFAGEARSLGAEYADLRYVRRREELVLSRNGRVAGLSDSGSAGVGVRVLKGGAWGFAATSDVCEDAVRNAVRDAIGIAEASQRVRRDAVRLDDTPPSRGTFEGPCAEDPFGVPLSERVGLVVSLTEALRRDDRVRTAEANIRAVRTLKIFASSEGGCTEQSIVETGAGMSAIAEDGGEIQKRSYPASFSGDMVAGGYEFVRSLALPDHVDRVRDEALALCRAPVMPEGEADVILEGSQLALQIHESCGHPSELDRVLGSEISFAGGSFLTTDKLGRYRYGSDIVSITADATVPGAIGSFGFDDEGVPAQRVPIIERGILVGYLSSRETAPHIGRRSSGAMRADGWNRIPLVRMVTVSLEPGEGSLEQLIADTRRGWLLCTNKSWSIDDVRLNFQFGCELAREIRDGKLGGVYRNPVYTGITPEFWQSCDAVCGRDEWHPWGIANCGKGEPMQTMHVAHGAAPARFRGVHVGGGR